jgi:Zn-dependent M16 (insulinase) family peptidase
MLANVTLDQAGWDRFRPKLGEFIEGLPQAGSARVAWTPDKGQAFEGLTIPAQVNYVGKGANLYRLGYDLDGSILVITKYLRATWLWERIRVQGGAYGGFILFDQRSGVLSFLSYRDPNLLATLENYNRTSSFLRQLDASRLNRAELTKTIIGTIGELDAYQLPDAKGFTSMARFLAGESDENRQRIRDQVLETSLEDFQAFAVTLDQVNEAGLVVVLGSQAAIEEANRQRPGWLQVQKVL